jgi:hypothetical protein
MKTDLLKILDGRLLDGRWKHLLLASAALTVTAAAIAGCASNYNPHGKDSGATY